MREAICVALCFVLASICCAEDRQAKHTPNAQRTNNEPVWFGSDGTPNVAIKEAQDVRTVARKADVIKNSRILRIGPGSVTDGDLAALPAMPSVEEIIVDRAPGVTDNSLKLFATFPKLRELSISKTGVSGKGFRYFATDNDGRHKVPLLRMLLLDGNKLTDDGLQNLVKMRVSMLFVSNESGLTAAGLVKHLPKASAFGFISIQLDDTPIRLTDGQLGEIKNHMPHTDVHIGRCHVDQSKKDTTEGKDTPLTGPKNAP